MFSNSNPIEVEIGSGRGRFIIKSARENPHMNYLGIERAYKFFHFMKERVEEAQVDNVRLLQVEADYFLWGYVPPSRCRHFIYIFPIPGQKQNIAGAALLIRIFLTCFAAGWFQAGAFILPRILPGIFRSCSRPAGAVQGLKKYTAAA